MRALLVEDEALVAMIVEESLTSLGFTPVCAFTASEALQSYDQEPPALVVIDVGLPDMRGDDLALRLRELNPELPIVLASGYDPSELRGRFPGDRRLACLAKPYTEEELAQALREAGAVLPA